MRSHGLDAADDRCDLDLRAQRLRRIVGTRHGRGQVAEFPGSQVDFAARISAKIRSRAPFWPQGIRGAAAEDAWLAAARLDHAQHEARDFELRQFTVRPHGRVVGVPALTVAALEIAILALQHLFIIPIEEGDHGRATHAAADRRAAHRAHDVVRVEWAQEVALP